MKKLALIDGMAVLHRAYHAYPLSLTTKKGELINAAYGFAAILLTALEKIRPTHVIVTWDVGKPLIRKEQYVEYKATREKPDDELINQIDRTKEIVEALNIPQFGVEGYEADDVIGTLARQATEKLLISNDKLLSEEPPADLDVQVVIVTGDKDTLQLVDDEHVIVYMPPAPGKYGKDRGPQIIDEVAFRAKYGLEPEQMIDLKGLMGDSSDNIPGVKGVGPKTATELLQEHLTIERVYENLDKIEKERTKRLLQDGRDMAFLSKKLATIDREVPIKLDWEACKLSDYDRDKAVAMFEELGFKSIITKLPKDSWEEGVEAVFK